MEIYNYFLGKLKNNVTTHYTAHIAIYGTFVALFGLWLFNQSLLMSFSLPLSMILMVAFPRSRDINDYE